MGCAALVSCQKQVIAQICNEGETECRDGIWRVCEGNRFIEEECALGCGEEVGCWECTPGTGECVDGVGLSCMQDGSGYEEQVCDPVQGMGCDVDTGRCTGACSPDALGVTYVGCSYRPVVTAQYVMNQFPYGVAVANTGEVEANVVIDGGGVATPIMISVSAGGVEVIPLPWVEELKACNGNENLSCGNFNINRSSVIVEGGAYWIRSDQPVAVYQFSPIDYTDGLGNYTYSNDASLLLPTNAWGKEYVAMAWPTWEGFEYPGFVSITAYQDDTTIAISNTVNTNLTTAGMTSEYTINAGDVIQLLSVNGDLTGTEVRASAPIQVIGGHYCTNVPFAVAACDHLEESIFPVETLGTIYLVSSPAVPALPLGKEQVVRIMATQENTTVRFEPLVWSTPQLLANAGDVLEVVRYWGDFMVLSDKPVVVGQYMEGQGAGGDMGDPSMTLAVPAGQYRSDYLFHVPPSYEQHYINVTAAADALIYLDGQMVTGFTPIGESGLSVAKLPIDLGPNGDGNHAASGNQPFGLSVYGYGQHTSYWYPGGLDLMPISRQ